MMFDGLALVVKTNSVSIAFGKAETITHYPGTDLSERFYMGRPATNIQCTLLAATETDLIVLLAKAHVSLSGRLYLDWGSVVDGIYYEDATCIPQAAKPIRKMDYFEWPVTFSCLDPVPYWAVTGARLY